MASDTYAGVKYGDPNANFFSAAASLPQTDWSDTKALYPLEGCQVSIIPPSSDIQIRKNVISYRAENEQGDSSFGTISSSGSHISVDEKGTVQIKASSPVAEDLTCGRIEVESQSNMRLNVGTSLAINVNASGQHDEEGDVSNSESQSVDKKRYPAFSINVSNGGLDIECADGDIFFSGRNITLNAAETLSLNATRAVNILSGYEPAQVATAALGGLFGFELPVSGGGEVVIKAGKFTNDSTTITNNSCKTSEKTSASKITETGSPMGTTSERQSGDKVIATSGNVWIQAGQKMRIEAQGMVTNPTGPSTPPVWGVSQLEPLVISVNKDNTPVDRAMLIEVENGDFVTSIKKIGDAAITTETGFLGLYAGRGDQKSTSATPGDLILESIKGSVLGTAKLDAKFKGVTSAEIGIGEEAASTDFLKFESAANSLTTTKPFTITGTGSLTSSLTGDFKSTISGAITNTVTGTTTNTYTGAYTVTRTGAVTDTITGAYTQTVSGISTMIGTGGAKISGGTVDIKADGAITIKGSTVDIDGPSGINLN